MTTFTKVKTIGKDFGGKRAIYKLSEPIACEVGILNPYTVMTSYVCADFAYTFDRGPETMLFPCDEDGAIISWLDLWCCYYDAVSNDDAIAAWLESRAKTFHDKSAPGCSVHVMRKYTEE